MFTVVDSFETLNICGSRCNVLTTLGNGILMAVQNAYLVCTLALAMLGYTSTFATAHYQFARRQWP